MSEAVDRVDDAVSGQSNRTLAASRCEPLASITTRCPSVDECLSNTHLSAGRRVPYDWVIRLKWEEAPALLIPVRSGCQDGGDPG
jgi:hypothetical protein